MKFVLHAFVTCKKAGVPKIRASAFYLCHKDTGRLHGTVELRSSRICDVEEGMSAQEWLIIFQLASSCFCFL